MYRQQLFIGVILVFISTLLSQSDGLGFGFQDDKVLLKDVGAITLYKGKMTSGRRSNPVPQLSCVGGSAGCADTPDVVQCQSRGSDGFDVQWECKAELSNAYKFGRLAVSCEGYEYPDDPYILRGSCGLEYTMDSTGQSHSRYQSSWTQQRRSGSAIANIIVLVILCLIIYALYHFCIATPQGNVPYPDDGYPGQRPHGYQGGAPPPAYGFRDDHSYRPGGGGCGSAYDDGYQARRPAGGTGGGGFWTGAATGGLLGYMFGNRGNQHYNRGYGTGGGWGTGTGWGSGWGTGGNSWGSGWGGTGGGSSGGLGASSSGTRTASGFGSTRRR